ncbi:hypothetical protein EDD85DRAFT_843718 [Armillaria nabsnona]|nr:hypothetical protein EDD85DRAFT_843718 [Armillaria nabsnona]
MWVMIRRPLLSPCPASSPSVLLYSGACTPEIHCDELKLPSAALCSCPQHIVGGQDLVSHAKERIVRVVTRSSIPNTSYLPAHLTARDRYGDDGTYPIIVECDEQTLPSMTWTRHFPDGVSANNILGLVNLTLVVEGG